MFYVLYTFEIILPALNIVHEQTVDKAGWAKLMRFFVCVFSFFKLLFFIRLFESYGFFVQMILQVIWDIKAYLAFYCGYMYMFSIFCCILDMKTDDEVGDA